MDFILGQVLRLKKRHPCGSFEWRVTRLGADIRLKCLGCGRHILIERATLGAWVTTAKCRFRSPLSPSNGPP